MYRVGIDIGGTFTDMLLIGDDGAAVIGKTLTTPGDPSLAVENALRPALDSGAVKAGERGTLIHGTTLVTNALIERKGALTALLTTAGFRDAVEIGREHRYELYDLNLDLPKPLVPRHLRFDVPERVAADGSVLQALDESFIRRLVGELRDKGIKEIGAGGGSVARVDSLGLLKVGPESSGAVPGPVCYRQDGTDPTVTDADLVLGYL